MTTRPKVFVLSATWPHIQGSVQAAEVVPFEIVRCLAVNEGCEVVYGCAWYEDVEITRGARAGIEALKSWASGSCPSSACRAGSPRATASGAGRAR